MRWRLFMFAMSFALAGLAVAPRARADEMNKETIFTFKEPIEVPGRVLPPGKYDFKLLDAVSDRDIVEVYNADQTHLIALFMGIPDYRSNTPGKTIVTFEERKTSAPEALKTWFYPGDNYGLEFVYPKQRAMELAKRTNQNVLAMPTELAKNITMPTKSATDSHVMEMKNAPLFAMTPTQQQVEVAKAVTPPPLNTTQDKPAQPTVLAEKKHLPKTASPLPLIGLLGLMSLGSGLTLRQFASRRS